MDCAHAFLRALVHSLRVPRFFCSCSSTHIMHDILVLGGGSAGLLAAITMKRWLPNVTIRIVRSPEIGVIGVGESTTPNMPAHLFQFLGLSPRRFYAMAEPTWKMGIHFIWGPRGTF